MNRKFISTYLFIILTLWLTINIILFPQNSINAASRGFLTWFNIVLPSLLPFFITSEILIGLGFVDFIGTLLGSVMRPIFNVPGKGAFPLAMSITSGYPVGVKLVTNLRKNNLVTKIESQRLVSFCSTSGPLFMIGSIATGMLNTPSISPLIIHSHYLGSITTGIIFRFYKNKTINHKTEQKNNIKYAINNLIRARKKDNRTIGILLSDSVKDAINSMLVIGGFIVFYSVLVEILDTSNILNIVTKFVSNITFKLINPKLIKGLLIGLLEITIGCKTIAETKSITLLSKIVAISFLIGWSGFSIHSQALSFINKTDINEKTYIFSKFLHGIFSSIYSFLFFKIKYKNLTLTSFLPETYNFETISLSNWVSTLKSCIELDMYIILTILISSIIIGILNNTIKNN